MPQSRSKTLFVIFVGPEQHAGPGNRYYTNDGEVTGIKGKAAKFYTFGDAKDFAAENNIDLTARTHIGREDFTEFELAND
ncbi:hypothetical protein Dvar_11410 [Desulfosarcina variabilis str. Montpellier]|uniref:hypothetical protein n=1 Tax=Desulfosarcina variabilis TaxID=2300 RepID=UPI003AFB2A4E